MLLGDTVKYIRFTKENGFEEGSGKLLGLTLDPKGHPVALIHIGEDEQGAPIRCNVYTKCLNATSEFISRFREELTAIHEEQDAVNDKIKQLAEAGNDKIDNLYCKLLGNPIKL